MKEQNTGNPSAANGMWGEVVNYFRRNDELLRNRWIKKMEEKGL